MYYDGTMLLLIPAIILSIYAQARVSSAYNKYSRMTTRRGLTGYQAARMILDHNGLTNVPIEITNGRLSDHYDPRSRVMRLSNDIYQGSTIAAISVAAHESGHAIQHASGYAALRFRNSLAPVASFASNAAWVMAIIGLIIGTASGLMIFDIAILLYATAVLFQIVTLPVELNASRRAIAQLNELGIITNQEEEYGSKKMLSAAALTYLGAMAVSIANLLRLLVLRGNRN